MLLSTHSPPRMQIQGFYVYIDRMLRSGTFLYLLLATLLLCAPIIILGNLPFQSITATIAAAALGLFFPLEQIGTILMIGDLEVAITKDCSGLGTASALIPCTLVWCLINKKNLLVSVALVYPILLIANTLRVISITLLAYFSGIELAMGVLHDLTGLLVFVLAFSTIVSLQSEKIISLVTNLKLERLFAIAILATTAIYLMVDVVQTYISSPLDRTSLPLFGFGLLFACLAKPSFSSLKLKIDQNMLLAFGLVFVGIYLDFRIILNTAILLIIFISLNQVARNKIWVSASIACLLASLPGLPHIISTLAEGWHPNITQCLLALILTPALKGLDSVSKVAMVSKFVGPFSILFLLLITIMMGVSLFSGKKTDIEQTTIPYLFNGWVGKDIPLSLSEERLFQHGSVVKREYEKGGYRVWLLHLQTSDRRSIHPPQYCYASDGWKISKPKTTDRKGDEKLFGEFSATKPDQHRRVKYWYEFSDEVFSQSRSFIRYKTELMMTGATENWQLYRISSDNNDSDQQQQMFIDDLKAVANR
jgi:exosortase/archaeosortase family protein